MHFEIFTFETFWCHDKNFAESSQIKFLQWNLLHSAVIKRSPHFMMQLLAIRASFQNFRIFKLMRIFCSSLKFWMLSMEEDMDSIRCDKESGAFCMLKVALSNVYLKIFGLMTKKLLRIQNLIFENIIPFILQWTSDCFSLTCTCLWW